MNKLERKDAQRRSLLLKSDENKVFKLLTAILSSIEECEEITKGPKFSKKIKRKTPRGHVENNFNISSLDSNFGPFPQTLMIF